jgi:hypothetical protein
MTEDSILTPYDDYDDEEDPAEVVPLTPSPKPKPKKRQPARKSPTKRPQLPKKRAGGQTSALTGLQDSDSHLGSSSDSDSSSALAGPPTKASKRKASPTSRECYYLVF